MKEAESLGALMTCCGVAEMVPRSGSHREVRYPEMRWKAAWLIHEHLKDIGKRLPLMLSCNYKADNWCDENG